MSTLVSLWDHAEQAHADKTALITPSSRLTYQQVGDAIRTLAANLSSCWQVHKGDVIALMAPNCVEFVVSYFAITHLGAVIQPIDERLSFEEARAVLADSRAQHLIVHQAQWPKLEGILPQLPALKRLLGIGVNVKGVDSFDEWSVVDPPTGLPSRAQHTPTTAVLSGARGRMLSATVTPDDVAELMYTSGTTGEPKGVMRSQRNVRAASCNSYRGFGYTGDDMIAIAMPLSHSSALNSQMMPLLELGGTLALMEKFDPVRMVSLIQSEGVTCMRAVPAMIRMLLALPDFRATALPSLRLIVNSSAPIDPTTYTELKHRFESIQVMNSYGLTEASTCTVLPDDQALAHADSVGAPIEGVQMRLVDEEGNPVPAGAEGEIWIKGEHVFVGYRNQPDKTDAVLVDEWLHTGDLAHQDEQGLYYLHGRRDDVINCAGRKFAPADVENCILQLPEVSETAVIGVPHPVLGQCVKAFVVIKPGIEINAKAISRHCAHNLPSHKVPFYVEFVAALPRNSTGKILRRKLTAN